MFIFCQAIEFTYSPLTLIRSQYLLFLLNFALHPDEFSYLGAQISTKSTSHNRDVYYYSPPTLPKIIIYFQRSLYLIQDAIRFIYFGFQQPSSIYLNFRTFGRYSSQTVVQGSSCFLLSLQIEFSFFFFALFVVVLLSCFQKGHRFHKHITIIH